VCGCARSSHLAHEEDILGHHLGEDLPLADQLRLHGGEASGGLITRRCCHVQRLRCCRTRLFCLLEPALRLLDTQLRGLGACGGVDRLLLRARGNLIGRDDGCRAL
jgi:hypothetical protein